MDSINISEFKAKCLAILERIARTGECVTILKRGKAIAQLLPATPGDDTHPQSTLRGTVEFLGDVVEPVIPRFTNSDESVSDCRFETGSSEP